MGRLKLARVSFLLLFVMTFLAGCEMIGDIFQAGIWVGVIVVVAIVGLILWLIGKGRK